VEAAEQVLRAAEQEVNLLIEKWAYLVNLSMPFLEH
jgi:hypothetical protein